MASEEAMKRLQSLFSDDNLAEALRLLPGQQGEDVVLAIVTLSEGSLDRLRYFAERARKYPTDVLFLREHVPLGEWSNELNGLLLGGPIEIPLTESATRNLEDDFWLRTGLGALQLCVVCGEPMSSDFAVNPRVELSRRAPFGVETKTEAVHLDCIDRGKATAHSQGYGWRMVSIPKS